VSSPVRDRLAKIFDAQFTDHRQDFFPELNYEAGKPQSELRATAARNSEFVELARK